MDADSNPPTFAGFDKATDVLDMLIPASWAMVDAVDEGVLVSTFSIVVEVFSIISSGVVVSMIRIMVLLIPLSWATALLDSSCLAVEVDGTGFWSVEVLASA